MGHVSSPTTSPVQAGPKAETPFSRQSPGLPKGFMQ